MNSAWQKYKLSSLVTKVGSGATPKGGETVYKASGTPLIRSMNVVFFGFKSEGLAFLDSTQADALKNAEVQEDDVLLNITGASIGRVTIAPQNMNGARVNQHVCIIRPNGIISAQLLSAYLSSPSMQAKIWSDNYGATRQALTKQQILDFEIPTPPPNEQRRIADKLDTTLARVDACRDRVARVAPLLKRFRQSVLAAATSGRLTEDWRKNGASLGGASDECAVQVAEVVEPYSHVIRAPKSWRRSSIGGEVEVIGGSQPPKSTFVDREVPGYIRLIQIRDYKSDKYLTYIPRKLAKRICNKDEVMIGRYGPPIFQILRGLEGAYNVALMKAQPKNSGLCLDYLFYFLKVDFLLKYIEAGSERTAGQDGIRKELLLGYPMFIPTIDEQYEIVRRVETLFAFADRLEARLATVQTAAARLTPALLAKAFRGELVPQDPNDEPASELLKRLAAQRAAEPKAKRTRKAD